MIDLRFILDDLVYTIIHIKASHSELPFRMPCAECLVMFVWSDQAFRNSDKARLAQMLGPAPFIRIIWKLDVEPFDGSRRGGNQCLIPSSGGFVFKSLVLQCFLDLIDASLSLLGPEDKQMSKLSWWPSIPTRLMIKLQFSTLFCTCGQWHAGPGNLRISRAQICPFTQQFTHIWSFALLLSRRCLP